MKRSEFKAYIREEVISTLSENTTVKSDVEKYIAMLDELKKTFPSGKVKAKASALIGDLLDYINMNEASKEEVENQEKLNKALERTAELTKDLNENQSPDYMSGYGDGYVDGYHDGENGNEPAVFPSENVNEVDEDDDEMMDKEASKAAKKGDSISKLASKLGETDKELKSTVKKWKNSEEPEKSKLLSRLKELTKIKKELEGLL